MARPKKFIKRPYLEGYLTILRARFVGATFDLTEYEVGRYKHCFSIDAHYNGKDNLDLMDCLNLLSWTFGNVAFVFDGREGEIPS